ncbi:MAG: hypothetical protein U0Q18_16785 [Bryobacteraceae bacterium]
MRYAAALLALFLSSSAFSDTLKLRNGQTVTGTYLGGTARTIKMEVSDAIQTYDVSDVASLEFTAAATSQSIPSPAPTPPPPANTPAAATSAPAPSDTPPPPPPSPAAGPAPAPFPADTVANAGPVTQIPGGTNITVRMIDSVDSETNTVGQTFRASLDEPIVVSNQTVVERGADVVVKLVDNKQSGKLTGTTQLALNLVSVNVNGRMVDINSQSVTQTSSSRGSRTAKMAGGGAALGAIIGAIAGGGKGAAIGAGAGAAAGTGAEIATKGQKVHVPSETRLTFVVDSPVQL